MRAQKVYGRNASRQYREVRAKYVPDSRRSRVLSQSLKIFNLKENDSYRKMNISIFNDRFAASQVTVDTAGKSFQIVMTKVPSSSILPFRGCGVQILGNRLR